MRVLQRIRSKRRRVSEKRDSALRGLRRGKADLFGDPFTFRPRLSVAFGAVRWYLFGWPGTHNESSGHTFLLTRSKEALEEYERGRQKIDYEMHDPKGNARPAMPYRRECSDLFPRKSEDSFLRLCLNRAQSWL